MRARLNVEQTKHAVTNSKVRPIVDAWRRQLGERKLELLTQIRALDEEEIRVDNALTAMGIPRQPSCTVPEVSDPLIYQVRARLERALAPAPSVTRERPTAKPSEPAYEPVTAAQ
jgi:hypothetical protein